MNDDRKYIGSEFYFVSFESFFFKSNHDRRSIYTRLVKEIPNFQNLLFKRDKLFKHNTIGIQLIDLK